MTTADKLLCAAVLAACCLTSSGQTTRAQARDLTLIEGRGELLQFEKDVQKVAVAEPKIADAVMISPREIMVNAKTAGRTTLMVWETGAEPARYEIDVVK